MGGRQVLFCRVERERRTSDARPYGGGNDECAERVGRGGRAMLVPTARSLNFRAKNRVRLTHPGFDILCCLLYLQVLRCGQLAQSPPQRALPFLTARTAKNTHTPRSARMRTVIHMATAPEGGGTRGTRRPTRRRTATGRPAPCAAMSAVHPPSWRSRRRRGCRAA